MSEDQELKVMGVVLKAMEPLEPEERKRILSWVSQKLSIDAVPEQQRSRKGGSAPEGDNNWDHSTDTIATIIGAKSGPDLVIAAAAHLHFTQGKQKFTRQELIAQMRSAPGHFRETFVNNMSSYLKGLTKAERLRLHGSDTYALSVKERQDLETKVANAG